MTEPTDDAGNGVADCLLTAEAIAAMPGLAKAHFLNADARRINKSLGDHTGLTGIGVHLIEVAPGAQSTECHVHHFEDECLYILSGAARAQIGGETVDVKAGDFIGYRKGGPAHTLHVTGAEPLRALVIGERLAHDVVDYPNAQKRLYRNAGRPWDLVDHAAITHPQAGAKK